MSATHSINSSAGHCIQVCDYTGQSYCPNCHWGVSSPSPARILSNWDFTPQPMAQVFYCLLCKNVEITSLQASLQYLALILRRPLVHLQRVAPGLAAVSEEVTFDIFSCLHCLILMIVSCQFPIDQVSSVAGQRHQLMAMKKYLLVCRCSFLILCLLLLMVLFQAGSGGTFADQAEG